MTQLARDGIVDRVYALRMAAAVEMRAADVRTCACLPGALFDLYLFELREERGSLGPECRWSRIEQGEHVVVRVTDDSVAVFLVLRDGHPVSVRPLGWRGEP